MLKTTVIGSYPKYPKLVSEDFKVEWLVSPGDNLDKGWSSKKDLKELQDEAVRWAVKEQETAGVDIITDGEQRRGNFVFYHCQHLEGFDFLHKEEKSLRGGTRVEAVPTIRGKVRNKEHFLVDEFKFLKSLTNREIKVTVPGPLTIIDSSKDTYYNNERALALDLAKAIREEVKALAVAGCKIIQFDEPAFIREPEKFFDYGLEALQKCFEGVEGITKVVHICRGYPNKERNIKAEKEKYGKIIEALSISRIDRISIEDAHENLNLGLFEKFGQKEVVLGVVDIGNESIEAVEKIEMRVRDVLRVISPEKLYIGPDCGLLLLRPEIARSKLKNMVIAAKNVRRMILNDANNKIE